MLQQRVDTQDAVIGLDNSGGNLRAGPHGKGNLGFLTVINGQPLQHEATKTGSGTTTDSVVDDETLKTSTVVLQFPDPVQNKVDNFLTNGIVTPLEVVGSIFLTRDQLFRVEQLPVGTSPNFIDNGRLQINEDAPGHVLTLTGLGEEGVEGIITTTNGLIGGHLTIGLDTVLEAEKLPTLVTDLDTLLSDVDTKLLSHGCLFIVFCR